MVDLELVAERHIHALPEKHMLEVEFPDDPDPRHRFFRIGTETIGMVRPIAIEVNSDGERAPANYRCN